MCFFFKESLVDLYKKNIVYEISICAHELMMSLVTLKWPPPQYLTDHISAIYWPIKKICWVLFLVSECLYNNNIPEYVLNNKLYNTTFWSFFQGLADMLFDNQPEFSLVSNGTECIMIEKKFFLEHASQKLMVQLRENVSYLLLM